MKAIPLKSCHKCKPYLWDVIKETQNLYYCKNCHRSVRQVLRLKKYTEDLHKRVQKLESAADYHGCFYR